MNFIDNSRFCSNYISIITLRTWNLDYSILDLKRLLYKNDVLLLIILDTFPKGKTLFQKCYRTWYWNARCNFYVSSKVINYNYDDHSIKYNEYLFELYNFIPYLTSIFIFYFGHNLFILSLGWIIRHLHKLIFHISTFKK